MDHCNPQGAVPEETVFLVPAMMCRHCVRAVSAQVRDVAGVVSLEADATTRTVRVHGPANPEEVGSAIAAAGYGAELLSPSASSDESTGGQL